MSHRILDVHKEPWLDGTVEMKKMGASMYIRKWKVMLLHVVVLM